VERKRRRWLDLIRRLKADGKTIVLVSHNMADVVAVASRVAIFKSGRKVIDRAVAGLDADTLAHMVMTGKRTSRDERLTRHPYRPARFARFEQRIDQPMHLERLASADRRLAFAVERVEEVGDDGAVPVIRERHRIGPGAAATELGLQFRDAPVMVRDYKVAAGERRGSPSRR